MHSQTSRLLVSGLVVILCMVVGCRKPSGTHVDAAALAEAAGHPEVVAKLAAADAVDGSVDGVVSLCAGCSLGMAGSDEHTLTIGHYTMYFCSDHCRSGFTGDVVKRILAISIPDGS